jgi:hypothetical protein
MTKQTKTAITVRLDETTLNALEQRAKSEDRHRAKMAELILKKDLLKDKKKVD